MAAAQDPAGRELFYRSGSEWFAVDVTLGPELTVGRPRRVFEGPFVNIPGFSYGVAPDGERFLVHQNTQQFEATTTLTVITGFFDELRRRVPADRQRPSAARPTREGEHLLCALPG